MTSAASRVPGMNRSWQGEQVGWGWEKSGVALPAGWLKAGQMATLQAGRILTRRRGRGRGSSRGRGRGAAQQSLRVAPHRQKRLGVTPQARRAVHGSDGDLGMQGVAGKISAGESAKARPLATRGWVQAGARLYSHLQTCHPPHPPHPALAPAAARRRGQPGPPE